MGFRYFLIFCACFSFFNSDIQAFESKDSTEATLTYSAFVDIPSKTKPTRDEAKSVIDDQVVHLFGPMGVAEYYAVPKGEYSITLHTIKATEEDPAVFRATYDYSGKIQVKKGPRTRYQVILPRIPTEKGIYTKALNEKGVNTCTDEHYNSWGDYWYFWNPDLDGCPLEEGVDYDRVNGTIERIPNTKRTYPEYPRLVNKQGEIPVYVFLGMDDGSGDPDPMTSDDENAIAYRSIRKALKKMGFDGELMAKEEVSRILAGKKYRRPYVEVYKKETPKGVMSVTLFFGPIGIDENSGAFHYFYKEANETASMMIYDGHSGLGGHLDLKTIEKLNGFKFKESSKKYQMFFFNSCTSYTYYNTIYFYRKSPKNVVNRTKSLDIMTNGLETEFDESQKINLTLIHAVDDWANGKEILSYQDLADKMDMSNLFGVNGDEDNPTSKADVK